MIRRALCVFLLSLAAAAQAKTRTGLDIIAAQGFEILWGKRVGVIVNHTSRANGYGMVELLQNAPGVTLAAVFSPEHGYTGKVEHGQRVADATIEGSGVPVYSLYGKTQRPTPEMLRSVDVLVFDIQDVGARFYTYITTLGYAMEEAAKWDKEIIVLDRPNPLGGAVVEGLVLSTAVRHFTAYFSIPARHGLTVGEIARLHNAQASLNARLLVIPMEGWERSQLWEETGLEWTAPSPNIRTPRTALIYSGLGAFESTNLAVGRGTDSPFFLYGAPWLKGVPLAKKLNALRLAGVKFRPATFTPKSDRYQGKRCYGVRVTITDPHRIRPVDIFVHAAAMVRDARPKDFQPRWAEMPRVTGGADFERLFTAGATAEEMLALIHKSAAGFRESRAPYLLYR